MVTFLSAFASLCFRATSTRTFLPVALVIVVVASFVLCVLFQAEALTMEKTRDTGTDIQLVQRW